MPEKRREAESCAAVCHEVTGAEALPEAVLVAWSDVANQQDGRASERTASATPFFGLTETARRAEMLRAARYPSSRARCASTQRIFRLAGTDRSNAARSTEAN